MPIEAKRPRGVRHSWRALAVSQQLSRLGVQARDDSTYNGLQPIEIALKLSSTQFQRRRGGRAVECDGLENR